MMDAAKKNNNMLHRIWGALNRIKVMRSMRTDIPEEEEEEEEEEEDDEMTEGEDDELAEEAAPSGDRRLPRRRHSPALDDFVLICIAICGCVITPNDEKLSSVNSTRCYLSIDISNVVKLIFLRLESSSKVGFAHTVFLRKLQVSQQFLGQEATLVKCTSGGTRVPT
ncbi:unnamed protein product [Microthlaspi erraticum]|uniref:Uncharacterized protein n=1 Tax=Microthlaspi erraticum TaxID=1685480 RepID=A0A6D2JA76_9BRAS|nr:unnamed protein product [Microthlaspi erraticum]CAA7029963.1 unnamed protein product [Microthlaspi erraticum]CAA7035908.1 unnamed protein product [Microthlaspi erraticum]CAA7048312.1 unnamed protein product [Microthlaspi erraticum]